MLEIRFHGLGGHGAVVAGKFLAKAAAGSGYHAQSFASYGARRRGGKVESYVRISETPIRLHSKMYEPDWLVLMDETFATDADALRGLKKNGKILINSSRRKDEYPLLKTFEVFTVDASKIASERDLFIPGGMPVINTTLLGALVAILKEIDLEHLIEVIRKGTPKQDKNIECATEGYDSLISPPATEDEVTRPPDRDVQSRPSTGRFPVYKPEKMKRCHQCQICYMVCPSLAIHFQNDPIRFSVNREVCTACGICIEECPRKAIAWEGSEND